MLDSDHTMRFAIVMNGLYRLMRFTALHSGEFRQMIKEREIELTMTVPDDSISRTFLFHNGKVRFEKGTTPASEVGLIWASPQVGARIMMKMATGDPKALMKAVMSGDLALKGDAAGIKWFLDLVNLLSKTYIKRKKKKKPAA